MAIEAMELDPPIATTPAVTELPERKRKHKTHDPASKKKRKHETGDHEKKKKKKKDKESKSKSKTKGSSTGTDRGSPYALTTATLYLPLSPISISPTHALASLLAEHLSPLLLTYYPPLKGIVLAYSNASISSTPPGLSSSSSSSSNPQPLTLAVSSHEYGVLYVYLTATFLVFRPQKGQILEGWVNVQSEGFLGAVVLNLFSVGIERKRLPSDWKWIPPGEEQDTASTTTTTTTTTTTGATKTEGDDSDVSEARGSAANFDAEKEHFKPVPLASDANPFAETLAQDPHAATDGTSAGDEADDSAADGYFQSVSGHRVRGTVRFRVLDIDVIPGTDRERGFMSVEGSMLSPDEEEKVAEDERNGVLSTSMPRSRQTTPVHAMSGALAENTTAEPATSSPADAPSKKSKDDKKSKKDRSEEKEKKEKKSKSKKDK